MSSGVIPLPSPPYCSGSSPLTSWPSMAQDTVRYPFFQITVDSYRGLAKGPCASASIRSRVARNRSMSIPFTYLIVIIHLHPGCHQKQTDQSVLFYALNKDITRGMDMNFPKIGFS